MTIRLKLLLSFLSLAMLILLVSITFYSQLKELSEPLVNSIPQSIEEFRTATKKTDLIYQILYRHVLVNRNLELFVLTQEQIYLQKYYENLALEDHLLTSAHTFVPVLWEALNKKISYITPERDQLILLTQQKQSEKAKNLLQQQDYIDAINYIFSTLNQMYQQYSVLSSETASVNAKISEKNVGKILQQSFAMNLFVSCAAILISLFLVFVGAYSISRPIKLLRDDMEKFSSAQDLDLPINPSLLFIQGEVGALARTFITLIEKLRSSEKYILVAEEANRLKSQFLANMSHELRTPLNGVVGFTELMLSDSQNPLDEEHREYLGYVLSCAKHLLQIINDILDIARIESGRIELNPQPVIINSLVKEVTDNLRMFIQDKKIKMSIDVPLSFPIVLIDPTRFKQILYNYLSNAIKFTPTGGFIQVAIIEEEDFFVLKVSDSGIGIAEENLSQLFNVFHQLDSSITKKFQGTGLGLALTLRIVEAQGGMVWVESHLNQGSHFYARLPKNTENLGVQ